MIGVNTAIFTATGTSAGVGFAIPVDTVRRIVPLLIANGEARPLSVALACCVQRAFADCASSMLACSKCARLQSDVALLVAMQVAAPSLGVA